MTKQQNRRNFKMKPAYHDLPSFQMTTPGVPLTPPIFPGKIQVYSLEIGKQPAFDAIFYHNKYVLIAIISGELQIKLENSTFSVNAGEMLLISPFIRHSFLSVPDLNFSALAVSFVLTIDNARMGNIAGKALQLRTADWRRLNRCTEEFSCWYRGDASSGAETAYTFGSFLNQILKRYAPLPNTVETHNYSDQPGQMLMRIFDILSANLQRHVTIDEISRKLNVSSSQVRTLFKQNIRMSIGRYARLLHMRRVQELLRSSGLNLAEIAEQTGYKSESALARAFKREVGTPPLAYRKQVHAGLK